MRPERMLWPKKENTIAASVRERFASFGKGFIAAIAAKQRLTTQTVTCPRLKLISRAAVSPCRSNSKSAVAPFITNSTSSAGAVITEHPGPPVTSLRVVMSPALLLHVTSLAFLVLFELGNVLSPVLLLRLTSLALLVFFDLGAQKAKDNRP